MKAGRSSRAPTGRPQAKASIGRSTEYDGNWESFYVVHNVLPALHFYAWLAHPKLGGFCIPYAGWYVEAHGHFWQRSNCPEGIYIYCTAGRGFYRCNGREWKIGRGDLLYCAPMTNHSYGADARRPWTIYWIHVAGPEMTTYSDMLGLTETDPVLHVGVRPRAVSLFQTVFHFLKPPMTEAQMAALAGAGRLLLSSLAIKEEQQTVKESVGVGIRKVLEAMEENIGERTEIEKWAGIFGSSMSHFQRQFKHATGESPYAYFLRMKMDKACSYLIGSPLSAKEIAFRLGFTDPLHFSRVFRRITGHSPTEYRRPKSL